MADLQALFAKVEGTTVAVDLLKVGQSMCQNVATTNGEMIQARFAGLVIH